ncbi:MAG: hypothetical protein ACOYMG_09640 [Candidatus Methylumidiphilus sp.]
MDPIILAAGKHSRVTGRLQLWLLSVLWFAASAQAAPTAAEVLAVLGMPPESLESLERGEIVSQPDQEAGEKELAMDAALYLPVPQAAVFAYLQRAEIEAIDADVTAHGEIQPGAGVEAFNRFAFSSKQGEEIEGLLKAEAGERFNLSTEEIDSFKVLRQQLAGADRKSEAEAVSRHYREILLRRWQAYRDRGLAGVAPYAHPEGIPAADPAAELRASAASDKSLAGFFPALSKAWLGYPTSLPPGAVEQFFWMNRQVEGRPTAVLGHRLVQSAEGGGVIAIRHYYVGHSYNSTNLVIGCLPHRGGSIVFYAQRTSTDQVAGMASGLRHAIGREQMKGQMAGRLESLRKALHGR